VLLLTGVGVSQIVATYGVFAPTYDEPFHIAAGLEALQYRQYSYEPLHPPLGRIAAAVGPYLAGARLPAHRDTSREGIDVVYADGNAALASRGAYARHLALARLGALGFFLVLCTVVYLWARRWLPEPAGLWALGFAVTLPPLLGHAALAALDVAGAAGLLAALYSFVRWVEKPSAPRALALGLGAAFAALTKFSNLPFLAACGCLALTQPEVRRARWRMAALAALAAFAFVWLCYGFSFGPLGDLWGPHPRVDAFLADHPALGSAWELAVQVPVPMPRFWLGLRDVLRRDRVGHDAYLFGEYRRFGWWYFFPVVLALKTPLALLMLSAAGAWGSRRAAWQQRLMVWFPAAILAVAMSSRINSGVRHILALYPFLVLLAGAAMVRLMRRRSTGLLALALAAWIAFDAARAHPDDLAWTNLLAGSEPERFLAESDLDWGQDLNRLARRLRELGVAEVAIAYFGSAPLEHAGLPAYRALDPHAPTTGWIAISTHHLYLSYAKEGSYGWLRAYRPTERVGKSLHLFYIPE
jgi:hypothetical protein